MNFTNRNLIFIASVAILSSCVFGYGNGTPEHPYQIATVADFQQLSATPADWDKCFILTADIDLAGLTFTQAPIAPDTNSVSGFQGTPFIGIFDGNGHIISNLTITASTQDYIGLIGFVGSGGQLKNMGVEEAYIQGNADVGGLVGYNSGSIASCHTTGDVISSDSMAGGLVGYNNNSGTVISCHATAAISGRFYVGGLVGYNYGSTSSCYATGTVSGSSDVGGLVGSSSRGTITLCYATGTVMATGSYVGGLAGVSSTTTFSYATGTIMTSGSYVGGLVGSGGIITSCYATGAVSGNFYVGGLAGDNGSSSSIITSCYATGGVMATGSYVGGLIGRNSAGRVICCYSTGKPTGISSVGGLCGNKITGGSYEDTSNFWDKDASEINTSTMGTGKTTAEMKLFSTFTDWDFTNIWAICEGTNYPRLQWQVPAGDFVCPDGVNVEDLDYLVQRWLMENCTASNSCNGADLDQSGKVDLADYATFAKNWLK